PGAAARRAILALRRRARRAQSGIVKIQDPAGRAGTFTYDRPAGRVRTAKADVPLSCEWSGPAKTGPDHATLLHALKTEGLFRPAQYDQRLGMIACLVQRFAVGAILLHSGHLLCAEVRVLG